MLLSILPEAVIFTTIRPEEDTLAFFLIIDVFSFIASVIRPLENTSALHLIILPFAFVDTSIAPLVLACTFDVVFDELTVVGAAVGPSELTVAVLLALALDRRLVSAARVHSRSSWAERALH